MAAVQQRWTAAVAAVAVMVLAVAASTARGQVVSPAAAPAPAGGIDSACLNSLLNMSDCLPYVQKGSTARRPDKPCCPELAGLVGSNPVCLCELLSGAADSYGIAVDYSRAVALPGICHVATPPVSTCADCCALIKFGLLLQNLQPSDIMSTWAHLQRPCQDLPLPLVRAHSSLGLHRSPRRKSRPTTTPRAASPPATSSRSPRCRSPPLLPGCSRGHEGPGAQVRIVRLIPSHMAPLHMRMHAPYLLYYDYAYLSFPG